MSHVEVSPKAFQVRFYDEKGGYAASMQMTIEGDRGTIHSLMGTRYYDLLAVHAEEIAKLTGTKVWNAYMQEWHVEAAKKRISNIVDIKVIEQGEMAWRPMSWVEMRLK